MNIKMSNCDFYVDKEKRTIVCVINNAQCALYNYMDETFATGGFAWYTCRMSHWAEMPKRFVGKAVCSEEDEWDEEFGKLLAFSRAKHKFYSCFFNRAGMILKKMQEQLSHTTNELEDFAKKASMNAIKLQARIKDYGLLDSEE